MSLLRFVDPSHGSIVIDGLDITRVALEDLRRRITFLPQCVPLQSWFGSETPRKVLKS